MNSLIKILIVDDDKDDAAFLIEGISNIISNFRAHVASKGVACLDYLMNNDAPELIFMDLNMPRQNGFDTLKSIKNDSYLKHSHVVIYSTSGNEEEINECYRLGAKFYILKPISLRAMTNILEQMFVGLGKPISQIAGREKFVLRDRKKQL